MTAIKLYETRSIPQLLELQNAIQGDPANQMPRGSLKLYTPTALKKLASITRAITWHLADKRAAAGNPVCADGYSGRQTNRRR